MYRGEPWGFVVIILFFNCARFAVYYVEESGHMINTV